MRLTVRRLLVGVGALILFFVFHSSLSISGRSSFDIPSHVMASRRKNITDAFQHGWDGYSKHCFGHDSIKPVSNQCEDEFGGWGVTAIDALSTAIIMENEAATVQILRFIAALDLTVVVGGYKVQLFEVGIRNFAGMISAWDLLNGPFRHLTKKEPDLRQALYNKTVLLGDALSCAFDTPSGIPHDWVDPTACQGDLGTQNTVAGAGTLLLEFGRLSDITGNEKYVNLAKRAESHLLNPQGGQPFPGLLGSFVDLKTGEIVDSRGSWGAFADSFYEYLLKAYIYNSSLYSKYLERWLIAADSTMKYIGSHPFGHPEWTLLASWSETTLINRMESLSWFAGGSFILGGMVTKNQTLIDYGLSIADAAGAVYNMTKTGLGAEFVTWDVVCDDGSCDNNTSIQISDPHFRLRPEALETWYYAYRATQDRRYVEWTWAAFEAINRYCRTDTGFSAISNVDAEDGGVKEDKQESFVLAEVLKYVYLTHLEDKKHPFHVQDSRKGKKNLWVFNTEAHPFLVAGPPV